MTFVSQNQQVQTRLTYSYSSIVGVTSIIQKQRVKTTVFKIQSPIHHRVYQSASHYIPQIFKMKNTRQKGFSGRGLSIPQNMHLSLKHHAGGFFFTEAVIYLLNSKAKSEIKTHKKMETCNTGKKGFQVRVSAFSQNMCL